MSEKLENFKEMWKEIRKLSEYSLEHPLNEEQYGRMMELADKLNIKGGQIPRGL